MTFYNKIPVNQDTLREFVDKCVDNLADDPAPPLLIASAAAGFYFACRTNNKYTKLNTLKDPKFSEKAPLTYTEAMYRSSVINRLDYLLILNIRPGQSYEGRVVIQFELEKSVGGLFVDYHGKSIIKINLNGQRVFGQNIFKSHKIHLPQEHLKDGVNKLIINFENDYVNDVCGLHSFIDTDQNQYLYSHCEPCYAHKIFPCFDQPDLKGSLKLRVIAPESWKVIGNGIIEHTEDATVKYFEDHSLGSFENGLKLTKLRRTPPISTYLYAIIVGPYSEVENKSSYKDIKMSLYCRQSILKYAEKQAQIMFDITCTGMKYYEDLFDVPFAFSKYDLIFYPEFNFGGMENVGAVTVSETTYLHKDGMNNLGRLALAYLLLHELAHMWFGNLVTMKWWDDLWLNESFATFIGYYTLENHPELQKQFPEGWVKFFSYKDWGYTEDQLSKTHAIAWHVDNTEQSETQFDGITYSKGAAVLKQLVYIIGFENFRDGMRHYFSFHKWRNADLEDFFTSLKYIAVNRKLNINLDDWKRDWICTAGYNEMNVFSTVENDTITGLTVVQSPVLKQFPKLRDHKIKVGLYYKDRPCQVIELEIIDEAVNEIQLGQFAKPEAILLNYADEDFLKIRLDHKSLEFFRQNLHTVKEVLSRALVWKCILDMVKDGKLNALQYIDFFINQMDKEEADTMLNTIFSKALFVVNNYIPRSLISEVCGKIFVAIYDVLEKKKQISTSTQKNIYLFYLIIFADRDEDVLSLAKMLENRKGPFGYFNRFHKLHILKLVYVKHLLTAEARENLFSKAEDNSNVLVNEKKRMKALEMSDPQEKEALWAIFVSPPPELSSIELRFRMEGFNHPHKSSSNQIFVKKFFDSIVTVYETQAYTYFSNFYNALFPRANENFDEILIYINNLLQTVPSSYTPLVQELTNSKEDMEVVRRNKTLCLMDRQQASTTYPWLRASRIVGIQTTPEPTITAKVIPPLEETVTIEFVREYQEFEHVRVPKKEEKRLASRSPPTRTNFKAEPLLAASPQTINTERLETEEAKTNTDIDKANISADLINSNLKLSEFKDWGKTSIFEDINKSQDLRVSQFADEDQRNQSVRISLGHNEERTIDVYDEASILSGERDEEDEEEATKHILKKNWKKQGTFNRSDSVMKVWGSNTKSVYVNMFKADAANFTFDKYIASDTEAKGVLDNLLQKHYIKLVFVFLHYQSISTKYPELSWQEFSNLCKNAKKVFGSTLAIKDLDQIFIQETKESPRRLENVTKERSLCRYEFVELLIRMALKKYIGKKETNSYIDAIDKFLEQDFLPNVKSADYAYEGYRYEKIRTDTMDKIFKTHEQIIRSVMNKFKKNEDDVIQLDEINEIMSKGNFGILPGEITKCFALSKQLVIDEINSGKKAFEVLEFVEFLEFIVRIAETTIEGDFSTFQKVESIIPRFAAVLENP